MPRRFGLPSVYAAAAVATAVTTAAPVVASVVTPAATLTVPDEPPRPSIVTAVGRAEARALVGDARWRVRRYYAAALPGFATVLTPAEAAELRADPRVSAVEPDSRVRALQLGGRAGDLGGRVGEPGPGHALGLASAGPSRSPSTGRGVTVYVLGTGVDVTRPDFGGRAWHAFDATGARGRFCGSHGTRAAAIAAGSPYGRAPGAHVGSVKVLGCDGSGRLSDVIAGLDWVRRHAHRPAVATLPVDSGDSPALATAVRRLSEAGVAVVTSPRAAGVLARHLEPRPSGDPPDQATWPKFTATRDAIRQNPSGTPNLLLHGGGL